GSRQRPDLPKEAELIPTIPAFDKLSLRNADHNDPRDANLASAWRHTQSRTRVGAFEQNPDHDLVLFGHYFLDTDLKVGEGTAKVANERLQLCRAVDFCFSITEPICNATLREEFVDRCFASFVPNLFEPAAN